MSETKYMITNSTVILSYNILLICQYGATIKLEDDAVYDLILLAIYFMHKMHGTTNFHGLTYFRLVIFCMHIIICSLVQRSLLYKI